LLAWVGDAFSHGAATGAVLTQAPTAAVGVGVRTGLLSRCLLIES
jgi:hypothetical protein